MRMRILYIATGVLLTVMPLSAHAASFVNAAPSEGGGIGQLVVQTITIDTEGDTINALEGKVSYDPRKLEYKNSSTGNSIISAWLENPTVAKDGEITFSGVIAGGYGGKGGIVLTLYFLAREVGVTEISVDGDVYRNDGKASRIEVAPMKNSLVISESSASELAAESIVDLDPPFQLKTVIAKNPEMFGGNPFLIVDAKDTKSGIARFELLESDTPISMERLTSDDTLSWKRISNPAPLTVPLHNFLYVRAVDKVGNKIYGVVSEASLSPEQPTSERNTTRNLAIVLVGLFVLCLAYAARRNIFR